VLAVRAGLVNGIRCSPRQLFEASRLADRCGSAFMAELDGGRVLMLLATAGLEPDLALELERPGRGRREPGVEPAPPRRRRRVRGSL
jgi:hypothetical protein